MKKQVIVGTVVAFLTLAGCDGSPTGPDGYATEDPIVQLAVSPHHFHIWETLGVFTVSVVDPEENPVTDFEEIRVERRRDGAGSWVSLALTHDGGGIYVGEYTFEESGSYQLRVAGIRPSDAPIILVGVNGSAGSYTAFAPEAGMYTALHIFTT